MFVVAPAFLWCFLKLLFFVVFDKKGTHNNWFCCVDAVIANNVVCRSSALALLWFRYYCMMHTETMQIEMSHLSCRIALGCREPPGNNCSFGILLICLHPGLSARLFQSCAFTAAASSLHKSCSTSLAESVISSKLLTWSRTPFSCDVFHTGSKCIYR